MRIILDHVPKMNKNRHSSQKKTQFKKNGQIFLEWLKK